MVSSSCSTTTRVLPRSRSSLSVAMSLPLSRWCRPMLGSSRMYSTPISEEPICVARRMRWLSPPESVAAARESVRYCRPTLARKCSRERISFIIMSAIMRSRTFSRSGSASMNSSDLLIGMSQNSIMDSPPTVTARASRLRRLPPQSGHGY